MDRDVHIPEILKDASFVDDPNDNLFMLPDLTVDEDGDTTLANTPSLTEESISKDEEGDWNMWELAAAEIVEAPKLLTWQAFEAQTEAPSQTCYISEAPLAAFDSAITQPDLLGIDNSDTTLVSTDLYATSLLSLGLGRTSIFFTYDETSKKFRSTLEIVRLSGFSAETIESVTKTFLECGNYTKEIEHFTEKVYKSGPNSTPARIALAESLSTALQTIQNYLTINPKDIKSILHLHAHFEPVQSLLCIFTDILRRIKQVKSDEEVLSIIFAFIQKQEHMTNGTYTILLSVLELVSRPFLEFVSEWSGLQPEAGLPYLKAAPTKSWAKSFVKAEERVWIDDQGGEIHTPDFILDEAKVPSFIPQEDVDIMFEAGRSLRFIREHHPEHPLAKKRIVAEAQAPKMQWEFAWQGIEGVERRAKDYERKLREALAQHPVSGTSTPQLSLQDTTAELEQLSLFGKSDADIESFLVNSLFPTETQTFAAAEEDKLSTLITAQLSNSTTTQDNSSSFQPPLSLLPSLCLSPILRTQSRILNHTTLTLLFTSHNLREHFRIQRQFQLLGNGLFSTRLSHALFAPELETAQRLKGIARTGGTMGLRLGGGRKTWPPASSELRLSLMGVLTESYSPPSSSTAISSRPASASSSVAKKKVTPRKEDVELPGDLSFGIRDLSEEEIEKCISPDSIEALDFLRLSYKPPSPLQGVMSPAVLGMYDRIFRLLLRQMRMSYVVQSLWKQGRNQYQEEKWKANRGRRTGRGVEERFRVEAHHFVSTVAGYLFDVGIDGPWRVFSKKFDEVEHLIETNQYERFEENDGIEGLRAYHEKVLQGIMGGCLLRKRQRPVMGVLEEIWGCVLGFEVMMRTAGQEVEKERKVRELYEKFAKKVKVFLKVLRGMGEKIGSGKKNVGSGGGRKGLFDATELECDAGSEVRILVERLEMSGYYAVR